jgi:23S rRNA (adenine2503-C2)-methyltransferase
MAGPLPNFHEFTRAELTALITSWGFSPVHAARLWSCVYHDGSARFSDMPEVPARLRSRLEQEISLARPAVVSELHSTDGFTRKYLLALADGRRIETVLMRFTGRVTACVSSQAGCAMGCGFCATGQMGFTRHLTPGEIVAQVLHVHRALSFSAAESLQPRWSGLSTRRSGRVRGNARHLLFRDNAEQNEVQLHGSELPRDVDPGPAATTPPTTEPERLRNVVLMGMGEPLHNYDAVMKAVDILRDQNGPAIGVRRITLSTVGVIPGIVRLADEANPPHLAVSLHAATQAERAALVPVATRWPLDALMDACRYYCEKQQRRIFFEWALIAGHNDTQEQAHAVGGLLRGLPAQVNLIPLNPTSGYDGFPSDRTAARRFQDILAGYGLPSTVRQRRGIDIAAGCGQLATATASEEPLR